MTRVGGTPSRVAGKQAESPLVQRLRAFQKSTEENRKCADCSDRGPTYICLDFQTFLCQTCSGIHRSFGHKIKGISLSEFSLKEVEALEAGGNERANRSWLAKPDKDALIEDSNQLEQMQEHLRLKYVEKRWWQELKQEEQTVVVQPSATNLLDGNQGVARMGLAPPPTPTGAVARTVAAPSLLSDISNSPMSGGVDSAAPWAADFGNAGVVETTAADLSGCNSSLLDMDLTACAPPLAQVGAIDSVAAVEDSNGLLGLDFGHRPGPTTQCLEVSAPPLASGGVSGNSNAGVLGDDLMSFDFGSSAQNASITESYPKESTDPWGAFDAIKSNADVGLDSVDFGGRGAFFGKSEPFGDLLITPAAESPLMEPAEEPAPASSPSLAQAMHNGGLDAGLQNLYKLSLEPPEQPQKQKVSSDRFDAFSAFDGLSQTGNGMQQAPCSGGAMTSQQLGQLMPQPMKLPTTATAPQQLGTFMPKQAGVCPQQLDQMNPQELLQMQAMVAQALQARSQQPALEIPKLGCPFGGPQPLSSMEAEIAECTASPPKHDFDDLFAAFQERNPIGGR